MGHEQTSQGRRLVIDETSPIDFWQQS